MPAKTVSDSLRFFPRWVWFFLLAAGLFVLRLAFGLWSAPVQPMPDEIQTCLIGLKYFTTGAWPYYGNDVVEPILCRTVLSQDPGPLQAFLIGLPWRLWPSPLAPFLLLNILSTGSYLLLAWYAHKRLPSLSLWFLFPWVATLPWCLHYSTGMMNLSYSIAAANLFFVALLESWPPFSLGWFSQRRANFLMGFAFSAWIQFHRTWVLILPLLLGSFIAQGRSRRWFSAPLFFLLGALPLFTLIVPTFFQNNYHFFRDASAFTPGLNLHNFSNFGAILLQYLAMGCFEIPRFVGIHTSDRVPYLAGHWYLLPGFFLWGLGYVQLLLLLGVGLGSRNPGLGWKNIRLLTCLVFLLIYGSFLCTVKDPYINTFCETQAPVILYSLYVWDWIGLRAWGRWLLWFSLAASLIFQVGYITTQKDKKASFYLQYKDTLALALQQRDYRILGKRRPGSFY